MPRRDIECQCGHTERVLLRGPNTRGQHDQAAARLARQDCTDCRANAARRRQAELEHRAARIAAVADWPTLDGTAAQAALAAEIRGTLLAELVARICDGATDPIALTLDALVREHGHGGDYRDWDSEPDPIARVYLTAALRQVSARWWIDRRDLAKRPRTPVDLVDGSGPAHLTYGGLLGAVESVMSAGELTEIMAATSRRTTNPAE
ncbi:hypothetical protein [Micromonospora sp. RL09-050-HVF-A]|uniref:hypothetical protein n=1 Tax=Micromonospora sp. RL09-050-HVF-A TaxID=1703433 RepID=UPI001C5D5A38|nr:hypothetical protein [Micromonospora sp. RL09-050-HVF-A]MBW4700326.1 hypothetical protein [Micromonospora sp. RL09-050-HVF-A]